MEAQGVSASDRFQWRAEKHIPALQRTLSRSCRDFVIGKCIVSLRRRANGGRHGDRSHRLHGSTYNDAS